MMSRFGDLVVGLVGLVAVFAGIGLGLTWTGATAVLVGLALVGRAWGRAFLRWNEVGAP